MTLHLVRHGLPVIDPERPAAEWELDPVGFDDIWALRQSGRLPRHAAWFCSPEPKAQQTAQVLTDGAVGIIEDLREHERGPGWIDDFAERVQAAFDQRDQPAAPGWEPIVDLSARLLPAVRRIVEVHGNEDVVLVGHGTAWTLLVAELTGAEPDLARWRSLTMPDLITVPPALR